MRFFLCFGLVSFRFFFNLFLLSFFVATFVLFETTSVDLFFFFFELSVVGPM